ncbi:hypothetical protein Prudu_424S000200, partial [Prunus dulcis]
TPSPDSIFRRNFRRRELRRPTSISGVVSCKSFLSSSSTQPTPFLRLKTRQLRWQRREKPAKTADITGDVFSHRKRTVAWNRLNFVGFVQFTGETLPKFW